MQDFEERADQLSDETIDTALVDGQIFKNARKKMLAPGAKLLVGPRGTGKTHLMRYTYLHALRTPTAPLVLYASFSRYLSLEPLIKRSPDALKRFHSWVLAKLLLSCFEWLKSIPEKTIDGLIWFKSLDEAYDEDKILLLVTLLERDGGDDIYQEFGQYLTIDQVLGATKAIATRYSRKRTVFLLDDAALTLSEQHLISFFEIFRLLKTKDSAPKASVYPGTTQYGPTFHISHEAESIPLWLNITAPDYLTIMGEIAKKRLSKDEEKHINPDTVKLFKFISFGIPRVFLRLLREYLTSSGQEQRRVNRIIENQTSLIAAEYDSLTLKIPQFSSIIRTGSKLFDQAVIDVASIQSKDLSCRNIILGIQQEDDRNPLIDRMLRFLIEIGLLFPLETPVSHGSNRKYDRYIPHLAFLYKSGAFRTGRSQPLSQVATTMQQADNKHPVRREIKSLLSPHIIENLHLDLPPCQHCGSTRINESQLFCHHCGTQLVVASLFEECMKIPLEQVPDISPALIQRIHENTPLRTIAHVYASPDASGALQQAPYVGPVRAEGIIDKVAIVVTEFLS